jgi:hypothetical protein
MESQVRRRPGEGSMTDLATVELLDGSWLCLDTRGADQSVAEELEIWALVPDQRAHVTARSGRSWDDVLGAGPLVRALRARSVTEAAHRAFESTARHLMTWWRTDHPLLTPDDVVDRARWVCWAAREAPEGIEHGTLRCGSPVATECGWTVDVESWTVHCDADGLTTLLVPAGQAGQE